MSDLNYLPLASIAHSLLLVVLLLVAIGNHQSTSALICSHRRYFPVFDKLKKSFFVGEMMWNFADFMTAQVGGTSCLHRWGGVQ